MRGGRPSRVASIDSGCNLRVTGEPGENTEISTTKGGGTRPAGASAHFRDMPLPLFPSRIQRAHLSRVYPSH
jgi:hypothetical protein